MEFIMFDSNDFGFHEWCFYMAPLLFVDYLNWIHNYMIDGNSCGFEVAG